MKACYKRFSIFTIQANRCKGGRMLPYKSLSNLMQCTSKWIEQKVWRLNVYSIWIDSQLNVRFNNTRHQNVWLLFWILTHSIFKDFLVLRDPPISILKVFYFLFFIFIYFFLCFATYLRWIFNLSCSFQWFYRHIFYVLTISSARWQHVEFFSPCPSKCPVLTI